MKGKSLCLVLWVFFFSILSFGQAKIEGLVDTLRYTKAPPYKIALDIYWLGNSWSVQFAEEAKYEAALRRELISDLYITDSEGSVEKQVANMELLLAKNPDIILVCPLSQTALIPVLERAKAKGIPVVFYGGFARTPEIADLITAEVSVDDVWFGRVLAEWFVEKLGGKGNIICLSGLAGSDVAEDRWLGAQEVFSKYPGIKILAHEYADWSYAKAKLVVTNLLPAFPKIDGVWADGASMAVGALDAFIEAGRPAPLITGEDYNGLFKRWIKEGLEIIAVAKPTYIGSEAILTALKILRGEAVPKHIDLMPPIIVSSADAAKFVRWDLSDEFWCHTRLPDSILKMLFGQ